jgi:hypothetical protein
MAHQIEQIAYVGETPWHGLGNQLSPNQPLEVWAQQAGMDWRIESSNVSYMAQNERGQSIIMPYEEQTCAVSLRYPRSLICGQSALSGSTTERDLGVLP